MAVTYQAQAEATDQLQTSRLVGKPSGVASGDYAVFFLDRYDLGSSFPAVTAPSGTVLRGTVSNARIETKVYLKKVASEINWTFSWSGARWSSLSVLFFRGPDTALDLATVPFNTATGDGTAISTTSVTTATGAALAWNVNTQDYASTTTHVHPTGYTEVHDFDAYDTAYKIAAGSSESAASATNSVSQVWIAALVALQEASSAGPKDLAGNGTSAAAATSTAAVDRPVSADARGAADGTAGLAAARPVAGQATGAAATTAALNPTRNVAANGTAAAAVTGDATFARGVDGKMSSAAAVTAALAVDRPMAAQSTAAAYSTGSLVGGIKDLSGSAFAGSAATSAATFTRGLDGSGSAASDAAGGTTLARGLSAGAYSGADMSGDLVLVRAMYRLVLPEIVERFPVPGMGSMTTRVTREVTVFGDENALHISEQGSIAEGGDDYGAIPFGTRYIWYGGHVNVTDDPAIKNLWLANGFEVENV